jgi:hypothetical protein
VKIIKTTSFFSLSTSHFFAFAFLLSIALCAPAMIYAQSKIIPKVKVSKKQDKAERPSPPKKPLQIKDRYRRPASTSGPEKARDSYKPPRSMKTSQGGVDIYQPPKTLQRPSIIKDQYQRPPSKRVRFNNQADEDNHLSVPNAEEGGSVEPLSFWQRLFARKKATVYPGSQKYDPAGPPEGLLHGGGIKYKPTDHEKISKNQHQHQGNILRAPPKQVEKQFGYKAEFMANYQGWIRVPKPVKQEAQKMALSAELQGAGMYKIKKEKDKAPEYTSFHEQIKMPRLKARTRHFEKLSEKVHQYEGDLRIRKPEKEMHPSVYYLKSKTKNSYEQKEKYRRWRLTLSHIFSKQEQPKHATEKPRKPRYDKDESDIWYY